MRVNVFLFGLVSIFFLLSCQKDLNRIGNLTFTSLNGTVQKGPFIIGTEVTVQDLNSRLIQSGKSYTTNITDNRGSFVLKNISLSSSFALFSANGYFFNEVSGSISSSPLQLYSLAAVSNNAVVNVNLMTHLEKKRVEYLVSSGKTFINAKKQAQQEVLKIFGFTMVGMRDSEKLDISAAGEDNAILLAITVLIEGKLNVGELSELLTLISMDLETDGIINNQLIIKAFQKNATEISLEKIRKNLMDRYSILGVSYLVPNFEKYVQQYFATLPFAILPYVVIGSQYWTLNNLDVSTYKNGDPIPLVTDPKEWATLSTGAYCYYNNDSATYAATYGKLYNWYAVNDPRGLAPNGWHIPSDAESQVLADYLGGTLIAGVAMKTQNLWQPHYNSTSTNSSGFSAKPAGARDINGSFVNLGVTLYLWESDVFSAYHSWVRWLDYNGNYFTSGAMAIGSGYSVRCIKN